MLHPPTPHFPPKKPSLILSIQNGIRAPVRLPGLCARPLSMLIITGQVYSAFPLRLGRP